MLFIPFSSDDRIETPMWGSLKRELDVSDRNSSATGICLLWLLGGSQISDAFGFRMGPPTNLVVSQCSN
jgi:hypothetical protein